MKTKRLLTNQISTLTHALRVAAERYQDDARTCRTIYDNHTPPSQSMERLAQQFDRQVEEARALANDLDEAVDVDAHYENDADVTA